MQPNYILQLNQFHRWLETHYLSANAQLLWFKFIGLFNMCGWQEWVQVDTRRLMMMVGADNKQTAYRARDALVAAGLVTYRKGRKGCPSAYRMHWFGYDFCTENATDGVTDRVTDCVTGRVPETGHNNKYKENESENQTGEDICPRVPHALREAWQTYVDARRQTNDPLSDEEAAEKLRIVQNYSTGTNCQNFLLRAMASTVRKNYEKRNA